MCVLVNQQCFVSDGLFIKRQVVVVVVVVCLFVKQKTAYEI